MVEVELTNTAHWRQGKDCFNHPFAAMPSLAVHGLSGSLEKVRERQRRNRREDKSSPGCVLSPENDYEHEHDYDEEG
jgi:hypothetical protein